MWLRQNKKGYHPKKANVWEKMKWEIFERDAEEKWWIEKLICELGIMGRLRSTDFPQLFYRNCDFFW